MNPWSAEEVILKNRLSDPHYTEWMNKWVNLLKLEIQIKNPDSCCSQGTHILTGKTTHRWL